MKKIVIFFFLLAIAIFLFVRSLISSGIDNIMAVMTQTSLLLLGVFFFISLANFSLGVWRWLFIIKTQGYKPPFWRLFLHGMAGYTMSYITPATLLSGEPVRIYLLMEQEKESGSHATASVITDKIIELFSLMIFLAIACVLVVTRVDSGNLILTESIFVVLSLLASYVFYRAILSPKGFFARIFRFFRLHHWGVLAKLEPKIVKTETMMRHFFANHKSQLFWCILLGLFYWFIHIVEFWVIFYALGVQLSFTVVFLASTLPMVTFILPIPAGLGAFESGLVITFSALGIDPLYALPMALVNRARDIVFVVVGLIHSAHTGVKMIKNHR